ncbi:PQQ-dependent sugar dehydrogenase [Actinopolymorpha pittospori]|uniref:Glucose/arabinose dehydrogenase n=1 Tax=Actinopolymorpha pittospori TaxID=648752 RepID=A0A927N5K1_9ACTN|nr:glucose/arabinose dehydrogenase [Actinopolymorpha pittospori]
MRRAGVTLAAVAVLAVAGCTDTPTTSTEPTERPSSASASPTEASDSPTASTSPATSTPSPRSAPSGPPRVSGTIAGDLAVPWGMAFLPDRSALIAERDSGRVRHVATDGQTTNAGTVPGVRARGEGGLLGLAVAPTFRSQPYVYASFTGADDNRIVRMRYTDNRLGRPEVVLSGIPSEAVHNGGRMVFGPDGMLYVGTGDATEGEESQDRTSLGGKILRITPEGRPAAGNPFAGSAVWSYGHRNVQGLAFDPDGRLWASEFGQDTWDEVNLIRKGGNYGWPEAEGIARDPRYVDPIAQWRTDDASPSGLAYAGGSLWMAGLRGERLWRIPIEDGHRSGSPQAFFTGDYGRLRTVAAAPDGSLWLTTSNTDGRGTPGGRDDRILRVTLGGPDGR